MKGRVKVQNFRIYPKFRRKLKTKFRNIYLCTSSS